MNISPNSGSIDGRVPQCDIEYDALRSKVRHVESRSATTCARTALSNPLEVDDPRISPARNAIMNHKARTNPTIERTREEKTEKESSSRIEALVNLGRRPSNIIKSLLRNQDGSSDSCPEGTMKDHNASGWLLLNRRTKTLKGM